MDLEVGPDSSSVRCVQAFEGRAHRRMSAHVSSVLAGYSPVALTISVRTIQTAVLIETLVALGAEVSWSSCVRLKANVLHNGTEVEGIFLHIEHLLDPGPCCCRVRVYFTTREKHQLIDLFD